MADASSSCSARTSRELRSKLLAHRCRSARASISCALIRTVSPDRNTEPSTMASTSSASAISGADGRLLPPNCIAEPREITRIWLMPCEVRGEFVGHPLGEVVLARIAGVVVERQHGDRSDSGRLRSPLCPPGGFRKPKIRHRASRIAMPPAMRRPRIRGRGVGPDTVGRSLPP